MSPQVANFGIAVVSVLVAIFTFAFANGVNKTIRFLVGCLGVLAAAIFGFKGLESPNYSETPTPIIQTVIVKESAVPTQSLNPSTPAPSATSLIASSQQKSTPTLLPSTANQSAITSIGSNLCPATISKEIVDSWRTGEPNQTRAKVQQRISESDRMRPDDVGSYKKGQAVPAGVLLATNFNETDAEAWRSYPVVPVIRTGSWGLWETTEEFIAPNAGACLSIISASSPSTSVCQQLVGKIPNSPQEVRTKFGLPANRGITLFYEISSCTDSPNGFIVEEGSLITMQVPEGGCIDAYSGSRFSEETVSEKTGGGRRAYKGNVQTTALTYRVAGCELKP
jgi:hypothetical protein